MSDRTEPCQCGNCYRCSSAPPTVPMRPREARAPVCASCRDSHLVELMSSGRSVMCGACPVPCETCRSGAYCKTTPCGCECHRSRTRPADATSRDVWDSRLAHLSLNPADPVDHPPHYGGDLPTEPIKVIEAWGLGFSLGNCVKYIARAGKKPGATALDDLEKAQWYLFRHIAAITKGGGR